MEDLIDYHQHCRFLRVEREYWVHPYYGKNTNSRLFLAAKELSQTYRKFVAFCRMSKESLCFSTSRTNFMCNSWSDILRAKIIGQYQRGSSRRYVGQHCNATMTTAGGSYRTGFRLIGNQSHLDCLVGGPPLCFKAIVAKQLDAQLASNSSLKAVAPWVLGLQIPPCTPSLQHNDILKKIFLKI